jgi:hypothetical protein
VGERNDRDAAMRTIDILILILILRYDDEMDLFTKQQNKRVKAAISGVWTPRSSYA